MPIRPDARHWQSGSAEFIFADRVSEAKALRMSLAAVGDRIQHEPKIDTNGLRNMLVFYGIGGVGKSRLSERLEAWCRHTLATPHNWGAAPRSHPIGTARWDFIGLQGQVDVPSLLIAVRAAITARKQKWPAFDLAFAAYLTATRPGQRLATTTTTDQTADLLQVLGGIAGDLGVPGLVTEFSAATVSRLVSLAMRRLNTVRQLRRFDSLRDILDRCGRIPVGDTAPELAADILWLLTEEVEAVDPSQRPLVAIFVDHFEKLQESDAIKAEQVVNLLMGYLPWVLFVVTGRNHVDWGEARDGLRIAGPMQWPLLSQSIEEPRQHLLEYLSQEDTRELLRRRSNSAEWGISDGLLEKIAKATNGWPLHIDAVCQLATNRTVAGDSELTEEDLLGELPDLVRRLFEDLTPEEAHVFNAACLLPFFDVSLVAAISGVTVGAVERCIRRTIVTGNPNSRYPFRVHEEIRRLVRAAGPTVKGGWSTDDWRAAARSALTEAQVRHDTAAKKANTAELQGGIRDDAAVIEPLALALTVALQEAVFDSWLTEAVRTAPTIRGLSRFLPEPTGSAAERPEGLLIRHIHALGLTAQEGIPLLRQIRGKTSPEARQISRSAAMWLAYRLRKQGGQPSEAIEIFNTLLNETKTNDRPTHDLLHRQIAITLRSQRLHDQAIAHYSRNLTPSDMGWIEFMGACRRNHGVLGQYRDEIEGRISRSDSARFRLELRVSLLRYKIFDGEDCRAEVQELLDKSIDMGMQSFQMTCHHALGMFLLARPDALTENIYRMRQLLPQYAKWSYRIGELLALRALLTRDPSDIEAAKATLPDHKVRHTGMLLTEIVLDELGSPWPPTGQPEEWLIPFEQVRANWLRHATGVIERAPSFA